MCEHSLECLDTGTDSGHFFFCLISQLNDFLDKFLWIIFIILHCAGTGMLMPLGTSTFSGAAVLQRLVQLRRLQNFCGFVFILDRCVKVPVWCCRWVLPLERRYCGDWNSGGGSTSPAQHPAPAVTPAMTIRRAGTYCSLIDWSRYP
jgi:hypothetical protein